MNDRPVLLTGFRPTGDLHLGHFFSLIEPIIKYHKDYQVFVMVADLHAMTELRKTQVDYDHFANMIHSNTTLAIQILNEFVDLNDLVIFRQSDNKEFHYDLFYKLLMVSRHAHTFGNPVFQDAMMTEIHRDIDLLKLEPVVKTLLKRFVGNHPEILWGTISPKIELELSMFLSSYDVDVPKIVRHLNTRIGVTGFATYPILMAADIILYSPACTLVGKDQSPHIQITNDLVKVLNQTFGIKLQPTSPMIVDEKTVKGCDGSKMSKTAQNDLPIKTIIREKNDHCADYFRRMITYPRRKDECGNPNECSVAEYWNLFKCDFTLVKDLCCEGKILCKDCKLLTNAAVREHMSKLLRHPTHFCNVREEFKKGKYLARERIMRNKKLYDLLRP
jgi:tryptophanyl-tRNA synthetase